MNEKRPRHRPTKYPGENKNPVNISLTQTGINGIESLAKGFGMTRSELIERIGRGELTVSPNRDKLGEHLAS